MIQYFKNRLAVLSALLLTLLISCVDADSQFGNSLLPPEWQMNTVIDSTITPRTYLNRVDSLPTISLLMSTDISSPEFAVGSAIDPMTGRNTSSLFTNFNPFYGFAESGKYFGVEPVIDSMFLTLYFVDFQGDTTGRQFELYEVKDGDFRSERVYFSNYDMDKNIGDETKMKLIMKFSLQSQPSYQEYVRERIRLPDSYAQQFLINTQNNTNPYYHDTLFHKKFKGLYLRNTAATSGEGGMYYINLSASSMQLHYHNNNPDAKDTTLVSFSFYHYDQNSKYSFSRYNTNFQMTKHDFSYANPGLGGVVASQIGDSTISTKYGYIGAMGGVGTTIVVSKEQIQGIKDKATALGYSKIAILNAELVFGVEDKMWENYDKSHPYLAPYEKLPWLNFTKDYNPFLSEDSEKIMGGGLNRTHGKYSMNISRTVQAMFKGEAKDHKVEIGPLIGLHNKFLRTVFMGSDSEKPPRLILTYTMLK